MRGHLAKQLLVITVGVLGAVVAGRIASAQQPDPQPAAKPATPTQATAEENRNPALSPDSANLTGRWILDPTESDDAKQKIRDAMADRPRPNGFGPGGGGPPMGGPRGFGGGRGRGGPRAGGFGGQSDHSTDGVERREAMHTVFEPPAEVTITSTDREITIVEKNGRFRVLHPDGKKYKSESGNVETRTRWEKRRLIVESRWPRDEKITESYDLAPDRSRLGVTLRLERPPMPTVTVRRVYLVGDQAKSPQVTE